MRLALLVAFGAWLLAPFAAVADVPLPPPRPPEADVKAPQRIATDPEAVEAAKRDCDTLFEADVAEAALADPIAWDNGCLAAAPVSVTEIKLANGKRIELKPAALLRCPMALAVANWIRDSLEPAAHKLGTDIDRIEVAASYDCRTRNHVFGALLSEHGKANALDIRSVHLASGASFAIEGSRGSRAFFSEMRKSACERFATVLGPGSDKPHETHLHVDLQQRRNNYRICQWILPPVPGATAQHGGGAAIEARGKKAANNP